jgi:lysozyme family protein
MPLTSEDIIEAILRREGAAYTNNPADKGGPTKWGITQATLTRYLGRPASEQDVQQLTREVAVDIYRELYVSPITRILPDLPPRVLGLLVDSNVQHNPKRWQEWFQASVGATVDGAVGPETVEKWRQWRIAGLGADRLFYRVFGCRMRYYFKIIHDDPTQATFANGWANRLSEFLDP